MEVYGKEMGIIYKQLCNAFVPLIDKSHGEKCRFAHPIDFTDIRDNEVCFSLYDVKFTLQTPEYCSFWSENENGRRPVYSCGETEGLMLFSSSNDTKYLPWYRKFTRDGHMSNSMYGQYINPNLENIVNKLRTTPNTRQCVFTIYSMERNEWTEDITDVPCTLMGIFDIVGCKLNLTMYMRSNDIYLGTPYNVMMFTYLQQVIYNELIYEGMDIMLGTYTHVVHCLHCYERDVPIIKATANSIIQSRPMKIRYNIDRARKEAMAYMASKDGDTR